MFIDGTVVNVAVPKIQVQFNTSAADVQWAVESYALLLSALLLVGGSSATAMAGGAFSPSACVCSLRFALVRARFRFRRARHSDLETSARIAPRANQPRARSPARAGVLSGGRS